MRNVFFSFHYDNDVNRANVVRNSWVIRGNKDAGFIDNDHYAACDFRLIIYGPCDNPEIRINGHLYKVTVHLAAGDYLEIDSRDNTVYQVKLDGRRINLFNQRDKESGIFEKIPTGRCSVYWATEGFGFDLTLFQERSEPVWNLL